MNVVDSSGWLDCATVRASHAALWTQDAHLAGLEGVRYVEK